VDRRYEQDRRSFFHVEAGSIRVYLPIVVASLLTRRYPEYVVRRRKKEIPMKTADQHHFVRSLGISALFAAIDWVTW
jgi:hypothetical protein